MSDHPHQHQDQQNHLQLLDIGDVNTGDVGPCLPGLASGLVQVWLHHQPGQEEVEGISLRT